MKEFIVEREQKMIQRNHISVRAKNKKEAIKFAQKNSELWGNAEFELLKEKFKAITKRGV